MSPLAELGSTVGRWWRWGGVALLVAGLAVAYRAFPTRPAESWESPHAFELDGAECRELRQGRLTTTLTLPPDLPAPVAVAEAAEKFNLEPALVCQANHLPADACARESLAPGEGPMVLPLYRERLPGEGEAP